MPQLVGSAGLFLSHDSVKEFSPGEQLIELRTDLPPYPKHPLLQKATEKNSTRRAELHD
jgi:hypothetical protein